MIAVSVFFDLLCEGYFLGVLSSAPNLFGRLAPDPLFIFRGWNSPLSKKDGFSAGSKSKNIEAGSKSKNIDSPRDLNRKELSAGSKSKKIDSPRDQNRIEKIDFFDMLACRFLP